MKKYSLSDIQQYAQGWVPTPETALGNHVLDYFRRMQTKLSPRSSSSSSSSSLSRIHRPPSPPPQPEPITESNVRELLNKLAPKTCETVKQKLKQWLFTRECTRIEKEIVVEVMMEVFTSNRYYAGLCAEVFWWTMDEVSGCCYSPQFALLSLQESWLAKWNTKAAFVDPSVNYDQYCDYVKCNDQLMSTLMFFTNVVALKPDRTAFLLQPIIDQCFQSLASLVALQRSSAEAGDTLVEMIAIIGTNIPQILSADQKSALAMYAKNKQVFTSRARFKLEDIMEIIKTSICTVEEEEEEDA